MIINAQQSDIQTYGDIKEFKTGIDPKNLEFITTLLSSNLYSDPEQSFIREIVSNAWDSHVEAGTTDTPVIVRLLDRGYGNKSVTIRDYGTGLSPERFKEVYCNIGSSTKRESNEFIGGFGIGKYSSLACSSTVYITSYYEGTAYYYVMVKSGNAITTNLLMEKPTDEKNGVEITIKNLSDLNKYEKALDYIVFFPNIFIDGVGSGLNSTKLKNFTNFAVANIRIKSKLLLGNVLYPCNGTHLSPEANSFLKDIGDTGIVIKFKVGELNITPNRESIIYTSDTVSKIESRIKEAKKELDDLVEAKLVKDYDDIVEYHEMFTKRHWYDPITDTVNCCYQGYPTTLSNVAAPKVTYKGMNLRGDIAEIGYILSLTPLNFKGVFDCDRLCVKNLPYGRHYDTMKSKSVLILNEGARMTEAVRKFVNKNWPNHTIVTDFTLDEFKKYAEDELKTQSPYKDIIFKSVYEKFRDNAVKVNLTTNQEFLDLKASMSTKGQNLSAVRDVILRVSTHGSTYLERLHFNSLAKAIQYLKGLKKGILLGTMDTSDDTFVSFANWKSFVYVKARKDIVNELKEMGLSFIVDTDWVISGDPDLAKLSAICMEFQGEMDKDTLDQIVPTLPDELAKEFMEVMALYRKANYKVRSAALKVDPDPHTKKICSTMKEYMRKYVKAESIARNASCSDSSVLVNGIIIKTKAYRVNGKTYRKFRNNELIRVLCRK